MNSIHYVEDPNISFLENNARAKEYLGSLASGIWRVINSWNKVFGEGTSILFKSQIKNNKR